MKSDPPATTGKASKLAPKLPSPKSSKAAAPPPVPPPKPRSTIVSRSNATERAAELDEQLAEFVEESPRKKTRAEKLAESNARKPERSTADELLIAHYFGGAPPAADGSDPWETFLRCLSELPNRKMALTASGLDRRVVMERIRDDRLFASRFLESWEMGIDSLEDEAVRRAVLGWSEPVYNQGLYCGEIQKFSDTLLGTLLKANRRKYRGEDAAAQRGLSEEAKTQLRSVFARALEEIP